MSGRKARFTKAEIRRILEAAREAAPHMSVHIFADGGIRFSPAVEKTADEVVAARRIVF